MYLSVKKVGIIRGQSQYDVMRSWTLELEKGFNKIGIEVIVYDIKYHKQFEFYDDIDFYVSVNGWGLPYLTKVISQPIIMYLADHVNDHLERIQSLRANDILTVMDRNDFAILEVLNLKQKAYFLPHAALEVNYKLVEKEIDILFLGSYTDPKTYLNILEETKAFSKSLYKSLLQILNVCIEDKEVHYLIDGINFLRQEGYISDLNVDKLMRYFIAIGRYLYIKEREKMLINIALKGYKIHIYGNGWDKSEISSFSNVIFNEPINYFESQKIIAKSKILLNSQAFLRDGAHERIFAGISNNTFVISNETPYIKSLNNEKIKCYSLNTIEETYCDIDDILAKELIEFKNEDDLDFIKENDTFEARAKDLIEIFLYHQKNN